MPLYIVRNDITKMHVDAIVNAANSSLLGGGGVDGAIHRAAGPGLLRECRALGGCRPGEAKATHAFDLPCGFVIHTVGPVWRGGGCGEEQTLASCYKNSLEIAETLRCSTVAFPLISAGAYGYPRDKAIRVAVRSIAEHLKDSDITVYLTVFDKQSANIADGRFGGLKRYIDDNYAAAHAESPASAHARQETAHQIPADNSNVYQMPIPQPQVLEDVSTGAFYSDDENTESEWARKRRKRREKSASGHLLHKPDALSAPQPCSYGGASFPRPQAAPSAPFAQEDREPTTLKIEEPSLAQMPCQMGPSSGSAANVVEAESFFGAKPDLSSMLRSLDESFSEMLLRKIDESGMTDSECYKRANIDRKLFSKIRGNKHYSPSKPTAIAFAIALRLDIAETRDLLMKAGYALSPSSKFDVIISYFITNKDYDVYEINEALFEYDQPLLGA